MKMFLITLAILVPLWLAAPASAHVVEVTTTLDVAQTDDPVHLRRALQAAVDDILRDTVSFTPTLVTVTDAQKIGERLYVRILVADDDGKRLLEDVQRGGATPSRESGGKVRL